MFSTIAALIITIVAVLVPDSLKSQVDSRVNCGMVGESKQKQHNNHPYKANREPKHKGKQGQLKGETVKRVPALISCQNVQLSLHQ